MLVSLNHLTLIYTPLGAEKILFCSDGAFEAAFSQIKKP